MLQVLAISVLSNDFHVGNDLYTLATSSSRISLNHMLTVQQMLEDQVIYHEGKHFRDNTLICSLTKWQAHMQNLHSTICVGDWPKVVLIFDLKISITCRYLWPLDLTFLILLLDPTINFTWFKSTINLLTSGEWRWRST